MDSTFRTRLAGPAAAQAIAAIYNRGIEDRIATFEARPREPAHIRRRRRPAVIVERLLGAALSE